MSHCAESLERILRQPLDYLHAQRLTLAPSLETPALRVQINRLLDAQLTRFEAGSALAPVVRLWVNSWSLLPAVAGLMGAYLAWPFLAEGGRLTCLSAAQRRFAALRISSRSQRPLLDGSPLSEQLQALGLNALLGLDDQVPQALRDRLVLQFPSSVVMRQRDLAPVSLDAALLTLAIQHARFDPDID